MSGPCSALFRFSARLPVVMAGSVVAVLGLTGCSGPVYQATGLDNPLDQSAYLWPDTAVDQVATGARTATPPVIFTVRASDWFNSPEETTALIARTCGPGYRTARIFRHDGAGSPLHPVELEVHCGDLKSRVAVYPEPGTAGLSAGLSENLSEMTTPPTAAETGDLVVLR